MLTSHTSMNASSSARITAVVATLAAVIPGSSAAAQGIAGCPAPETRASDLAGAIPDSLRTGAVPADAGAADIVLFAAVEARSVRFNSQPRVRVRLCWGNGAGDTLRVIERSNLPKPVAAGVTYRDVYVATELLANLKAVCLLRELGLATPRDTTSREVQREIERRSGVCKRAD